jgi:hypothetical protein
MENRIERVEPIKPKDITNNLEDIIHPAIIKAVNALLKERYRGSSVSIKTKEISNKATQFCSELTEREIYDKKHLDFEPIFRKAGWKVEYKSPDRDESFDPYFSFSAK